MRARRAGSLPWLQGLGCGVLVTFALPVALFCAGMLAPALLAAAADRLPGRPVARATAAAGVAASLHPALRLWRDGHDLSAALALLSDPGVLGLAWAAGAGGWLMAQVAPVVIGCAMNARATARAAMLRAERARCEAEWSLPPA